MTQSEKLYKAWLLKEASFKFREAKTQEEADVYGNNNGYTEGTNNVIKGIKRNAYGYHKFENLRKRIFLVSSENSHQVVT